MRRLWLLFAQTVTVGLAIWFIVTTLKPDWVRSGFNPASQTRISAGVTLKEALVSQTPAQNSYRGAAGKAMPSVVNIYTSKEARRSGNPLLNDPFLRRFFGDQQGQRTERQSSLGSGVIVSAEGYILTNNHVVESADEIEVALTDGRKARAKVVGTDPETDLAVIKIEMSNLPVITLGNSDQAQVGDVVLAIGNPFGVGQTVTMGIVSALGRTNLADSAFQNFIQTDAAVNPGNSGGALVDANGNLLGINTAIYSQNGGSVGIGFAIPISIARQVMESIISQGQVVRGWIGVELQDITPELADSFGLKMKSGAIITGVVRDGPAFKAGMKPGDILLTVEGKNVTSTTELLNLVAQLKPGNHAKIKVLRSSSEPTLDIAIGKRPVLNREE
ncbi:Do family serine endopeptidase [Undibacterium rugosum]|uniref:Do family serine endopeptidase n=1 Tax=Undibacterium rugosum TaxID=2762291 RepID=A0A923I6C1_9BURK|nr:Do family serine endopeptidase [Undibacterium rugosum]MBC3936401.1 Do family serine endopeptidase [Undibacterium rugosum]MBR7779041.1 Do family serine endopeptidase [Undibacterium rugosum]